jgi:GT2 family glycosyltransferase
MEMIKKICVVVPVFNRLQSTRRFVESFKQSTYKQYTIVIVDDGSTDSTYNYFVQNNPEIVLLKGNGNYWWSGSTNEGVKYALNNDFDYVLTINNDSHVEKDTLQNLVSCAEKNPDSLIGARVMLSDTGKIWSLGVSVRFNAFPFLYPNHFGVEPSEVAYLENPLQVDALVGNGVLIPVDVFRAVGIYDNKWCPQYHGDTEFTYRAAAFGFRSIVAFDAVVYNNDYVAQHQHSIWDALFSKRSPYYWKPFFRFYHVHAPFIYKPLLWLQFMWIPKRIVKDVLRKTGLTIIAKGKNAHS